MNIFVFIGFLLVIALIVGVGVFSGRSVKDSKDFLTGGGRAGAFLVFGTMMGSLVGSQATVGTAQLAFSWGLSAWWFTLGSGIGLVFLALFFAKPFRESGSTTVSGIITKEFGKTVGSLSSVLCSLGIFISVLAQIIACTGLITLLFPGCPTVLAILFSVALMIVYIVFGGSIGAGMGGVVKMALLYASMLTGAAVVLYLSGGLSGLHKALDGVLNGTALGLMQKGPVTDAAALSSRYYSLVARGVSKDIGSGVSLVLGILSTQVYTQATISAKDLRSAKNGAWLGAVLTPPIGLAGIAVGMYMRTKYVTPAELAALSAAGADVSGFRVLNSTIQAFPTFAIDHLPPLVAGMIVGTLLITIVAGGAGLSLSIGTIFVRDIYRRFVPDLDAKKELIVSRSAVACVLAAAAVVASLMPGTMLNDLGFLSMALRATVIFIPLCFALYLSGSTDSRFALVSMIAGPASVIAGKAAGVGFDPLFIGMAVTILVMYAGYFKGKKSS